MAQWVEVTVGGVRWWVAAEWKDRLLGPGGLRLDEWLQTGQARVVKQGPHRIVYRLDLPGLSCYLKHNKVHNLRAWLRQLVRPSKARIEYRRAVTVAARQAPTIVPLAVGEVRTGFGPGDSFLITHTLESTQPLNHFLETTFATLDPIRQTRIRQRLAVRLGEFMAHLHDAGIRHNDLHCGNLLLRFDGDDQPSLFLIDLHAVHVGPRLGWKARRGNLVMLNCWLAVRTSRSDRLRFWRAYCRSKAAGSPAAVPFSRDPEGSASLARQVEQQSRAWNERFWRRRDGRSLKTNRYYRRLRARKVAGHAVTDLDRVALEALLADPDGPFRCADVQLLKDSRSSTVAEFDMPVQGRLRRVIYKRFRVTTPLDPWVALVRYTPALRSWIHGHGLCERSLPTARPLAVFHRRRRGLSYEGYLLTEKIPDVVDQHGFIGELDRLAEAERRPVLRRHIEEVARLVRDLHGRQLSHRDLKAANLLSPRPGTVAAGPAVWFIDLVGVRRYRRLGRRRRVQNLGRLSASFAQCPSLTRTDKLRFLRMYLQWGLFGRLHWKCWWREIEQATQAKMARNARSGRPLL